MSKDVEILIVEGNLAESEHLKHILEQHDYRVSVENNGKLAIDAARANPPQIVISAVLLPEMDGYALCRAIKTDKQLKNIPVILLTSLSDASDIIRGMECGADNFITKPYDEELLISRTRFILLNRELRGAAKTQVGVEVIFHGEKYSITPERQQMVDLLISTFETAVQKNIELTRVQTELNRLNDTLEEKVAERTAQLTEEISDRRAAEASLLEQKEFLRDVIDVNPNPLFVKDREGRFTLVNKAMAALYGTTTTAIIGKTDEDLNGKKAEVERNLFQDKQVIETAQRIHIPEEEFTHQKTGEVSWFQTTKMPIARADGEVRQFLGVSMDITDRKYAANLLQTNFSLLTSMFEATADGILVVDLNNETVTFNKKFIEMWRIPTEAALQKNTAQIIACVSVLIKIDVE